MGYSQQFQEHTTSQLPVFAIPPTSKTTSRPTASDCHLFHLNPSRLCWFPFHSTVVPHPAADCRPWVPQRSKRSGIVTEASSLGLLLYTKAAHLQQSREPQYKCFPCNTIKSALKSSSISQSVLEFFSSPLAQTHHK